MQPEILILDRRGSTAGTVERRLRERGAAVATLFLEEIHEAEQKVSFRIGPGQPGEASLRDSRSGQPFSLSGLRSVWAEALDLPANPMLSFFGSDDLSEVFAANGQSESWLLARSLVGWLAGRFLFLPQLMEKNRANHRLYQMAVARDAGFRLPATYAGSELPRLAETLAPVAGGQLHYRPFSPLAFTLEGRRFVSADRFLAFDRRFALSHLRAPALFAVWPAHRRRLHAAVIGEEVSAVELALADPDLDPDVTDPFYQRAEGNLRMTAAELPAAARELCLRFAAQAGLRFVVLDLLEGLEGEDGAWLFLEAHPGGSLRLFDEAGLRVGERLLDLLEGGR